MTELTELQALKETASNMGLKVGNIKNVNTIKEMIAEKNAPVAAKLDAKQEGQKRKGSARKDAMALVRVRITPMSPFERQLPNTLIDVGNKAVNVKRVVQFNEPWHVEQIVLDALKARKFRSKKERVDPSTRKKIYENVFSPSYGIEILPALSRKELDELKADQAARHAID